MSFRSDEDETRPLAPTLGLIALLLLAFVGLSAVTDPAPQKVTIAGEASSAP
ncbi:MAG: hypothetical protein HXY22_05845 [Alphaproteobacteria bacterium]|nr:hypothetical protein [Alphaproteobacteria bacterium]